MNIAKVSVSFWLMLKLQILFKISKVAKIRQIRSHYVEGPRPNIDVDC